MHHGPHRQEHSTPAKLSRPDFAAALRRAGLAVSDAQIDDIDAHAWPSMEALLDRLLARATSWLTP